MESGDMRLEIELNRKFWARAFIDLKTIERVACDLHEGPFGVATPESRKPPVPPHLKDLVDAVACGLGWQSSDAMRKELESSGRRLERDVNDEAFNACLAEQGVKHRTSSVLSEAVARVAFAVIYKDNTLHLFSPHELPNHYFSPFGKDYMSPLEARAFVNKINGELNPGRASDDTDDVAGVSDPFRSLNREFPRNVLGIPDDFDDEGTEFLFHNYVSCEASICLHVHGREPRFVIVKVSHQTGD